MKGRKAGSRSREVGVLGKGSSRDRSPLVLSVYTDELSESIVSRKSFFSLPFLTMTPITRRALLGSAAIPLAASSIRLPNRIRLSVIGLQGHVSDILGALPGLPDVEVTAVQEPDTTDLEKFRKKFPAAKVYTDYRRMLDEQKPDVVAVCPPNGSRHVPVLDCLARNLNFIAEKPLAVERADFEKIRRAAAGSKSRIGMLLPMRFDPEYQALRNIVASGAIGEVAQINSQKSYKAGDRPQWMKDHKGYGGTIPWIGIHMVDLMRWTSGREFVETFSYQSQFGAPSGIGQMENTTGSLFRLDNGGVATLHMDYYRPESSPTHGDDRLRLAGPKGVAEYQAAT